MNGIELAKAYYETYGKPMLERFPEVLPHIAVGVLGSGSEWLGFDDEYSRDHDFGPGFMIFLPGEDLVSRRQEFLLERAYAALPDTFMGFTREKMSPVGGNRFGVRRMADFFENTVGKADGQLGAVDFLRIPEQYLLEATNGAIFYDGSGAFSEIRARLSALPADVRLKKIAGSLVALAQAAPYNFERCLSHGETGGAELALVEFQEAALHLAFLINHAYMPFYKWRYRAAKALPRLTTEMTPAVLAATLEDLLTHVNMGERLAIKRSEIRRVTDALTAGVTEALEREGFRLQQSGRTHTAVNPYRESGVLAEKPKDVDLTDLDPGRLAERVNDLIQDPELRAMHILSGV